MPAIDTFPRSARWGSVGLDCAYCAHFLGPASWPDSDRTSACQLHQASLAIELNEAGYKNGEWFCRDFSQSDPRAEANAVEHLQAIRDQLRANALYLFGQAGTRLEEHPFGRLP